ERAAAGGRGQPPLAGDHGGGRAQLRCLQGGVIDLQEAAGIVCLLPAFLQLLQSVGVHRSPLRQTCHDRFSGQKKSLSDRDGISLSERRKSVTGIPATGKWRGMRISNSPLWGFP